MTIEKYTSANSPMIAHYEKINHVSGVTLTVDRMKVLSKTFASSNTLPKQLSYQSQIDNWESGKSANRVNTNTLPSGQCTPEGFYWVMYQATFSKGNKVYPSCSLDSFKRSNTKKTFTSANSTTIAEYEKQNNVSGVSLVVDYSKVISKVFANSTTEPTKSPYQTQIDRWVEGFSYNRVNTDSLPGGQCTPEGWYWVAYHATFFKGNKVYPSCSLDAFKF